MKMNADSSIIEWSEIIIIFNSLIRSIEQLRGIIDSNSLDDDDLYDAEEELNDYIMLLTKLRQRYSEIPEKGELTKELAKKLREIC